jgi:hypothetical protein
MDMVMNLCFSMKHWKIFVAAQLEASQEGVSPM